MTTTTGAAEITAYVLRTHPQDYIGKRVTFTVVDRWGRPGKDKAYDGTLTGAEVVLATTGPACTAIWVEGVRGAIWVDDKAAITVEP
jgi:hypothetical protein